MTKWLSWGVTATLLIATLSGIIISYPYHEEHPLISTVGIETVVPFGDFFRTLHYFSGQLTLLLLWMHTIEALIKRRAQRRPWWAWSILILTLPAILFILFTGYVIRDDETGFSAGRIAEHLALSIPWVGKYMNHLFFLVSQDGVHRPWLIHVYLTGLVLGGTGLWHFRLRLLSLLDLGCWGTICTALSLVWPASLVAPQETTLVKGPWFFLGVQELLRYLPPFWAGIAYPSLPVVCLLGYYWRPRLATLSLLLWALSYGIFLLMGACR